jgi:hypothetical protein
VLGIAQTNPGEGFDLTFPLILLVLAGCSVLLARTVRRQDAPLPFDEPPQPVWVPWRRSNMQGPSWNDPRPPEDSKSEWSGERKPPAPPAEHEEWTPPVRRTPTRRT